MKLLAIDTSTQACSAALLVNDSVTENYQFAPKEHTQLILPMVDELFEKANLSFQNLDGLVVTQGPGSFTGLRIGISIIQAFSFAHNLPIAPVSTLATLAQTAYRQFGATNITPLLDARMNQLYYGQYAIVDGIATPKIEDQIIFPENLTFNAGTACIGSGWDSYQATLLEKKTDLQGFLDQHPHAKDTFPLALPYFKEGKTVDAKALLPVYIRDSVTNT